MSLFDNIFLLYFPSGTIGVFDNTLRCCSEKMCNDRNKYSSDILLLLQGQPIKYARTYNSGMECDEWCDEFHFSYWTGPSSYTSILAILVFISHRITRHVVLISNSSIIVGYVPQQ